ncbi:MAG: phenylalanine--tRNA ligase subunit alpha, partial [Oscillospiraceae bacterium]|nr:phenylalanine--tRNA ligase subunit alpha [Oscillospiraceae bacterium]
MKEQLEQMRKSALEAICSAADERALEDLRVKYLGRKGELTAILKDMGRLSAEERPIIGQVANEVREAVTNAIKETE